MDLFDLHCCLAMRVSSLKNDILSDDKRQNQNAGCDDQRDAVTSTSKNEIIAMMSIV